MLYTSVYLGALPCHRHYLIFLLLCPWMAHRIRARLIKEVDNCSALINTKNLPNFERLDIKFAAHSCTFSRSPKLLSLLWSSWILSCRSPCCGNPWYLIASFLTKHRNPLTSRIISSPPRRGIAIDMSGICHIVAFGSHGIRGQIFMSKFKYNANLYRAIQAEFSLERVRQEWYELVMKWQCQPMLGNFSNSERENNRCHLKF